MSTKATTAPTTPRAPKRTTEQQLTDVATKLLALAEKKLATMKAKQADAECLLHNLDNDIPALEKQIAAQRAALGIYAEKDEA